MLPIHSVIICMHNSVLNTSVKVSSTNGIMMIGSSPTTNDSFSPMAFEAVYYLSIFQTEVSQSCTKSVVQSHVYSSLNASSADFVNHVSAYISNKRGSIFVGMWAMYTEWRDMCVSPTSSQVL